MTKHKARKPRSAAPDSARPKLLTAACFPNITKGRGKGGGGKKEGRKSPSGKRSQSCESAGARLAWIEVD